MLTLSSAFSALADIGGDNVVDGLDLLEHDADTFVTYDDVALLSVNDDLADAIKLPVLYVQSTDIAPNRQYGNVIHDIKTVSPVEFYFNPYIVNNKGYFTNFDLEFVLTFENGYDPAKLGVSSSATEITGTYGFSIYPVTASNSRLPTGFRYVDDNTVRISYSYSSSTASSFTWLPHITLTGRDYLVGNSVKCDLYFIRDYSSVAVEGGDGGGGSGSGGAAT